MALSAGTKLGPYEIVSPLGPAGWARYIANDMRVRRFGDRGFATKSQHSRSTNGVVGSERQGSEWIVGNSYLIALCQSCALLAPNRRQAPSNS